VQLVAGDDVDAGADLGRLAHVLGEDAHLGRAQVRQERDDVALDLDDEARLVGVGALHDLDMVAGREALAHAARRHLDLGRAEVKVGVRRDEDDLVDDRLDRAVHALLVALEDVDVVARLEDRLGDLARRLGDLGQVERAVGAARAVALEARELVDRRVHVLGREGRDADVLLAEAVDVLVVLERVDVAALRDLAAVRLADLLGVEQALRRAERDRDRRALAALLAVGADLTALVLGRQVDARDELDGDDVAVLGRRDDLGEVAGVLAALEADPAAGLEVDALLLGAQEVGHLLEVDEEDAVGPVGVQADEALDGAAHVPLGARLDVDVALERVALERRDDLHRLAVVGHGHGDRLARDRQDEVALATDLRASERTSQPQPRERRRSEEEDEDAPCT